MLPFNWMGEDACQLRLYEIEDKLVKTNLLADQAITVHCQLQEVLKMLENDVNDTTTYTPQSSTNTRIDKKEVLKKLIRVFNNFSFIKNVFEIDCEDFCLEYQ